MIESFSRETISKDEVDRHENANEYEKKEEN